MTAGNSTKARLWRTRNSHVRIPVQWSSSDCPCISPRNAQIALFHDQRVCPRRFAVSFCALTIIDVATRTLTRAQSGNDERRNHLLLKRAVSGSSLDPRHPFFVQCHSAFTLDWMIAPFISLDFKREWFHRVGNALQNSDETVFRLAGTMQWLG